MKYILIAAALALSSCATDVVYKPVRVEVPVSIPCKTRVIQAPVFATGGVTAKSTTFEQARALAVTNEQRKSYEALLQAEVKSCQ